MCGSIQSKTVVFNLLHYRHLYLCSSGQSQSAPMQAPAMLQRPQGCHEHDPASEMTTFTYTAIHF